MIVREDNKPLMQDRKTIAEKAMDRGVEQPTASPGKAVVLLMVLHEVFYNKNNGPGYMLLKCNLFFVVPIGSYVKRNSKV